MQDILIGTTDRTVTVFIPDPASTDGSGKTGLTHADLTVSYTRVETDNDVVVTDATSSLSTLTALTDAHTDWGVKEVSSTLAPGLYRLDPADAVFASGAWYSVLYVMITSSAAAAVPTAFRLIDPASAQIGVNIVNAAGTAWNSGGITANTLASDAITAAKIANGAIDAATFAADVDAEILSYLVDDATRIDASALNTASAAIGSNGSGLTEAGGTGDQFTAIPWNAAWDAEVQSEATDALNAYDPPTKAELDAAVANVSVDEIQATALADLFNTDSGTTYASAVAGSVVKEIADNAGGSSLTVQDIVDGVWDEAQSGHTGPGTFGLYLDSEVSAAGGGSLTVQDIVDGVLDEALSGHTTAGTVGKAISDTKTDTTAILADTNELQTDWANGGRLDLLVDAVKAKTDSLTFTVAGHVDANTLRVGGTTQTGRDLGASVLLSPGTGTGQISLSSGAVTVGTNNDKTGYTASTVSDKTGYSLSSAGVQAIWDALTSALTSVGSIGKLLVDNINATISSRLASASYTAPLDAAGTRTAVGLASANLDTQLDALPTATENADALLDRSAGVETNRTLRQALRLILASTVGKLSGAATTTVTIRDTNDSKDRVVATVTADGDRTAVTYDAT